MTTFASRCIVTGSARAGTLLITAATFVWLAGAAAAEAQCVGDCNGDGSVSITELIIGVNIALGTQDPSTCRAFQNQSGHVDVAQLLKGVNNALGSCPIVATPTVTTAAKTPTPTGTTGQATPTSSTGPSATTTPTLGPTASPTPCGTAVCGDGCVEAGESCDPPPGDTEDDFNPPHDTCPANCVIRTCQIGESLLNVDVLVQLPAGVTPGALQTFLRYPDGVVSVPGGPQASVAISNLPDDAFGPIFNGLLYAVRVEAVGPSGLTLGTSPPNRFFTAQFNLCQGSNAPVASDFYCKVETATALEGADVTATTTCSVALQ